MILQRTACCLLLLAFAGCVDLGPQEPERMRWLHPEPAPPEVRATVGGGPSVDLVAVRAAAFIDDRVAWRRSEVEVGYYDLLRWTEPPEDYVRRALEHELYAGRGSSAGAGEPRTRLSVELVAFEEELGAGTRAAHVALDVVMLRVTGERRERVEERRAVGEAGPTALAFAMRDALAAAIGRVGALCQE